MEREMDTMTTTKTGQHYTVANVGNFNELLKQGEMYKGKLFLKDILNLTGMEVSLNQLPPGAQVPFYHAHIENEELYIFLKGHGQFQIDGEVIDVTEGSVIRVGTGGLVTWRNNSTDEDLLYIVIQAKQDTLTQWTRSDATVPDQKVTWPE